MPRSDATTKRRSATGQSGHRLLVFDEGSSATYALASNALVTIGRGDDCDVRIASDSVSRRHAAISTHDGFRISDLGSSNGTFVGDRQLARGESMLLEPGTLIRVGNARVVIDRASPRSDDAPPEPDGPMENVMRLVGLVAGSALPVFLLGESGVGKGWLAEEIHRLSPRSARPFVSLNCAAMPEALLESELFGHERGAFTGAVAAKPGLLEAADQGTVFLDEIGEAPVSTQAKLLHVLERNEVLRVGATRPRPIDVRFLAATNRDVESATASGAFRRDLYFRLAGVPIRVPPLRERTSEIPALARAFVAAECARSDRAPPELSPETIARLCEHPWVGNIRELRNVLARATLVSRGSDVVRPEHILFDGVFLPAAPARPAPPPAAPPADARPTSRPLADHVRDVERDRIVDALERAGGHQGKAAAALGISRRTLTNKLNELALPRPRKRPPA